MPSITLGSLLILGAVISFTGLAMSETTLPTAPTINVSPVQLLTVKPFITGGQTEERNGDANAQIVADAVKSQIQEKLSANQPLTEFVVEKYKTQVVAGTNYFLKIRTAPGNYIHARVFRPLGANPQHQLNGLEESKQLGDHIGFIHQFE